MMGHVMCGHLHFSPDSMSRCSAYEITEAALHPHELFTDVQEHVEGGTSFSWKDD